MAVQKVWPYLRRVNRNITDGLNYLSKLNRKRLWNMAVVRGSYLAAKLTKKPVHRGMPISVSIEPTTSCNLRCPQCPSGLREFSRPTGMLQEDLFRNTIDQLAPTLTYLTLYFQGEPYLNPAFLDMVAYADSKKIYTATSTNCHHVTPDMAKRTVESGLDRLIISVDGITQDIYKQYRIGGCLDKVMEGTRQLVEWKRKLKSKTPHLVWQFIVFKHNEHQIEAFKDLAKQVGVDEYGIKTAQVYDYENGSNLIPDNPEYSRYKEDLVLNGYSLQNKLLSHCWRMWQGCVITWDGKVVPCCFDKDATHQIGDLQHTKFKDIWRSKPYQQFRASVLRSRKEIDICQNCSEGTKIWND